MPGRILPIATGEIYHVFNRGIDRKTTFCDKREFERAMEIIQFYRFISPPMRFSFFKRLNSEIRMEIMTRLFKKPSLVDILSYCLMPNHFHFCLKQCVDNGISKFMSVFQNSFTRYSNTKNRRIGPLFLDQFKAIRIETDEQLLHVSRYIHLNPWTSFLINDVNELKNYSWSSFSEFLNEGEEFCKKDLILSSFKNKNDYKKFVFDQADYQRTLGKIKNLLFD